MKTQRRNSFCSLFLMHLSFSAKLWRRKQHEKCHLLPWKKKERALLRVHISSANRQQKTQLPRAKSRSICAPEKWEELKMNAPNNNLKNDSLPSAILSTRRCFLASFPWEQQTTCVQENSPQLRRRSRGLVNFEPLSASGSSKKENVCVDILHIHKNWPYSKWMNGLLLFASVFSLLNTHLECAHVISNGKCNCEALVHFLQSKMIGNEWQLVWAADNIHIDAHGEHQSMGFDCIFTEKKTHSA